MELLMRTAAIVFTACLLGFVIIAGGCSNRYKLKRERLDIPSPWPFVRGEVSAVGSAPDIAFSGRLGLVWEKKTSGKPAGPLTIYHGALVFADAKKKIRFYDLASGDHLGRLKSKGIPQTGVVIQDSIAFYSLSPKENRLYAINLLNRKVLWQTDVKDASPGSILVNSSLIVSSGQGEIAAWSLDGLRQWRFSAEGRFVGSASFDDGQLYQPSDRGVLYVLSPSNGNLIYQVNLDGPLVAPVAIGRLAYAGDTEGNVYGLDPATGNVVWRTTLDGPIWTSPAVTDERVFVGHSGGQVAALDAATGRPLWTVTVDEVIKASPVAIGSTVVAATAAGLVVSLNGVDGSVIDSTRVNGSIDVPPVTDGRRVYVATSRGKITCLGDRYEYGKQSDQRNLTEDGS